MEVLRRVSAECHFFFACLQEHVKSTRTFHVNHDKIEHQIKKNKKTLVPSHHLGPHTLALLYFSAALRTAQVAGGNIREGQ